MICFPTPTHHSTGQLAWRSHQELPPTHLSAPQEGIKSGITLLYDIIPQSRVGSQFSSLLVFRTPAFRMVPPTTDWAFPCQSIKTCSQVKLLQLSRQQTFSRWFQVVSRWLNSTCVSLLQTHDHISLKPESVPALLALSYSPLVRSYFSHLYWHLLGYLLHQHPRNPKARF